jgi:alpha-L-arabinofuranosidase
MNPLLRHSVTPVLHLTAMSNATITILPDEPIGTVSPLLHGHFAEHLGRCCNDGLWVGSDSPIPNQGGLRTDVIHALREVGVPVLRWPGGCYADTYHWRDGIGPIESRPRTLGESCGVRVVEDNGLGTHEFIRLCREIGAEPYLAGNVGSGTPQEMMDWLHYCNGTLDTTLVAERAANGHPDPMNVRYWGVGNENWGCGGNYDAVDYAKEFRRYATFLRQTDPSVELVACGGNEDSQWDLELVQTLKDDLRYLDHIALHQYYKAGHATEFTEAEYYQLMRAGELVDLDIRRTDDLLNFFTNGKRHVGIAFDEWGVWHPQAKSDCGYEMPNTLRDAVAAAGVMDALQKWCGRVTMANLAQVVNVLQCLIQTDGPKMWFTPTYHLFHLYKPHRGALALRSEVECMSMEAGGLASLKPGTLPLVSTSASRQGAHLIVTMSNRHRDQEIRVTLKACALRMVSAATETLAGDAPNAVNSAEHTDRVNVTRSTVHARDGELVLNLPACSVLTALITCGS